MRQITDDASTGQSRQHRTSPHYNKNAYEEGYKQGYDTGYHNTGGDHGFRVESNYAGSSNNAAFLEGYQKGCEVGSDNAKNRRAYNLR